MTDPSRPAQDWTIRPFQPGDAPAARRLIEAVWREHFGQHIDPFVRDFIHTRLSDVDEADIVYGDGSLFLCAYADGEVIGTGAIKRIDSQLCEMVRMFVASPCRGRGIGRAIAEQLIGFSRLTEYGSIRLSSNVALQASHRLYERLGFRPAPPWEAGGETHSRYYCLRL